MAGPWATPAPVATALICKSFPPNQVQIALRNITPNKIIISNTDLHNLVLWGLAVCVFQFFLHFKKTLLKIFLNSIS